MYELYPMCATSLLTFRNVTTHTCNVITHVCNVITHMCNVITHVCNIITHVCNVIIHVCNVITHVCNVITYLCNVTTHTCNVITHMCNVITQVCNVNTHTCRWRCTSCPRKRGIITHACATSPPTCVQVLVYELSRTQSWTMAEMTASKGRQEGRRLEPVAPAVQITSHATGLGRRVRVGH